MDTHWFALAGLLLVLAPPVSAQTAPEEETVVVTARRSGAPMWEVRTGESVLLLVGDIKEVPKATPWRPDALVEATAQAQRVVLGAKAKISPGDVFRILFSGGKLKKLPEGKTTADYLSPAQQQRLEALERRFDESYTRQSLLITAFDLLARKLRFNRDADDGATEVVRSAARRANVATKPVAEIRGEDLLDSLFGAPPETHVACLDAAMEAVDGGTEGVLRRGRDWTRFDVPAVMGSPIEKALGQCWPWTDGRFGPELRRQWIDAVRAVQAQPGVTLAVVPLRVLAEGDGILDQLEARGLEITGPKWRAPAPAGTR